MNALILAFLLQFAGQSQPLIYNTCANGCFTYDIGKSIVPMRFYAGLVSDREVGEYSEKVTAEKVELKWEVKQPSYTVTAVKDSLLDGRAHISMTVTIDKQIITYDRYVDDADWIKDAKAVTADMAKFVMDREANKPQAVEVKGEKAVTMSDSEINAKVQEVQGAKAAEKVKP